MLQFDPPRDVGDGTIAVELPSDGRTLRLAFEFDRVPPQEVRAVAGDESLDVYPDGFGRYLVEAPTQGERVIVFYRPGVGGAAIDAIHSGRIEALERSAPNERGLGALYQEARAGLERHAGVVGFAGTAAELREAREFWMLMDLATTAFQHGSIAPDARQLLEDRLGPLPIDFAQHASVSAAGLQAALARRMRARLASHDREAEPSLDLTLPGEAATEEAVRIAGRRAGTLMLWVIDGFPSLRLVPSGGDFVVKQQLWSTLLGFASGALHLPLVPGANGQFNCSPNSMALGLFAEYARAASAWSASGPPLGGEAPVEARWRALWPAFVAMIDAFRDSYPARGGARCIAHIGRVADRAGHSPWTPDECERARARYSGLEEPELLRQWHRLLRALDRDNDRWS